jgi:hypothetical protein
MMEVKLGRTEMTNRDHTILILSPLILKLRSVCILLPEMDILRALIMEKLGLGPWRG